ncbi:MAG: SRPBCC family protein [Myxococcota bacterium]
MNATLRMALGLTTAGVLLAALVPALLPGHYEVSRTAVVRGTPAAVTHYVSHFPDRLDWVPWKTQDPNARYAFTGTPTMPGASMSWDGEVIGQATLTLTSVVPGIEVVSNLDYDAPFDLSSTDRFTLVDLGNGRTKVTWTASGDLPYGPDRFFGVVADQVLGPDYEAGLKKLDAVLATASDRS